MKGHEKAPSGAVDQARKLRRNSTDAEKLLWRELRKAFPKARFRRQSPVGPFIVDFLSHRHKLIVEADGSQHDSQDPAERRRTAYLEREDFTVLRFWNNDFLANTDGVLETIGSHICGDGNDE